MKGNIKRKDHQIKIKLNAPFAIAMGIVGFIFFFLFFFNLFNSLIEQSFINKILFEVFFLLMFFLCLYFLFYFANSKIFIFTNNKLKFFRWNKQKFNINWKQIKKIYITTFEGDYFIYIYRKNEPEWYMGFDTLLNKKLLQIMHTYFKKYSKKFGFLYDTGNLDELRI